MGKNSTSAIHMTSQGLSPNSTINLHKKSKNRRKKKNKTKKNIKKLFDQLRNESDSISSTSSQSNTTVIEIDDSTIVETNNNNSCKENNSSLIIIKDDEDLIHDKEPCSVLSLSQNETSCPLQCSTPIPRESNHVLQESSPTNGSRRNSVNSYKVLNGDVINLTKEINRESFLTIDLTTDSGLNTTNKSELNTVIDLSNITVLDCASRNSSCSMSGDSDVTMINTYRTKQKKPNGTDMKKFTQGIEKMNSSERGKLLEYIAQKIFKGCSPSNNNSLHSLKRVINRSTETVEDTYIKEVILGQGQSRDSIGSNIYNPEKDLKNKTGLRMIVIDGSNVAMQHTKGRIFSVKGLKICIDYFVQRGHVVKAFVPHFRCKYGKSTDGKLLDQLERQGLVVYTPSREIQGKMITSYDDRYIVQCAAEFDGVIVSGDNYRDLLLENPRWRFVIENRLLQFTWVGDMIMFPRDPLGRSGPTLQEFLRHPI